MSDAQAPTVTLGRETKAKRTILLALTVGGGMAVTRRIAAGESPQPRTVVAAFVAGAGLLAAAEVAPQPAAAFAILMLSAAIVETGPETLQAIRKATA